MPSQGEQAGLDIHEDETFQKREWLAQRVAWAAFAVVLLIAGLGFFGGGPLSRDTVSGAGVSAEYERFARRQRAIEVVVRVERAARESIVVDFDGPYLKEARLERVVPQPARESSGAEGTRFVFDASPGEPAEFTFHLTPSGFGSRTATLVVDGTPLTFSMFVFP